ncbi:glycosyltransferase [Leclercia adecarboxylata]|uniref:glycosyltransferase n=1 Tax=Leclercia adecarboxylata TaxID=83655 RepID=UPI002550338F|nr:glycosyltransferase [Leclercia adecarboxylata]
MEINKEKILVVLGERFYYNNGEYVTNQTSGKFLAEAFPSSELIVCSHVTSEAILDESYSVDNTHFIELPFYASIKDFVKQSFTNPLFLINYIRTCNRILDNHPGTLVWARNPSIGCLIFSWCALKKKHRLINHMCANAMLGWSNPKYNKLERLGGVLFSGIIGVLVKKISVDKNTLNLCTGDKLYNYCHRLNSETYQFVDLLVEAKSLYEYDINPKVKTSNIQLLYLGRIEKDKGLKQLCEAVVAFDDNSLTLNVVGGGNDFNFFKNKYAHCCNIIFHGPQKHTDVSSFLHDCDAVVVPSTNLYEGFPRVIMEAWCYKKPVIASDVGGVKAFVKDSVNGILVPPGNIEALIVAIKNLHNEDYYNRLKNGVAEMKEISNKNYWYRKLNSLVDAWLSK